MSDSEVPDAPSTGGVVLAVSRGGAPGAVTVDGGAVEEPPAPAAVPRVGPGDAGLGLVRLGRGVTGSGARGCAVFSGVLHGTRRKRLLGRSLPNQVATKGPTRSARTTPPIDAASGTSESLTASPAVYWVQVGAFLDHRNADRLLERLRGEGFSAATTTFEQSRVLYRVLLAGAEGGRVSDDAIERVRGLGHPVETTAEGPAVTGLVPLRRAVETSHTLRQQGVPVRLKQEVSSATYRVVRVGSFATVAEAEAALATLTARGVDGVVVRGR